MSKENLPPIVNAFFFHMRLDRRIRLNVEVSKWLFKKARAATFVAVIREDGRMYTGISVCSKKDQFVKKIGRAIALGRSEYNGCNFPDKSGRNEQYLLAKKQFLFWIKTVNNYRGASHGKVGNLPV